jgi:hypothetical protein
MASSAVTFTDASGWDRTDWLETGCGSTNASRTAMDRLMTNAKEYILQPLMKYVFMIDIGLADHKLPGVFRPSILERSSIILGNMSLLDEIEPLKQAALAALKNSPDLSALEQVKGTWIGAHGKFTALMKQLGTMPKEEKPAAGKAINQAKAELETVLEERRAELEIKAALPKEPTDFTLPGRRRKLGRLHPLTQVTEEIVRAFRKIGFVVADGPDGAAVVAELGDTVERVENHLAGAFRRTEQRRERLAQMAGVADDVNHRRCPACAGAQQGGRIIRRARLDIRPRFAVRRSQRTFGSKTLIMGG